MTLNPQFWWYTTRATGIVAWVLSLAAILVGVLLTTRVLKGLDRPAWMLDLHRWLGGLSIAFAGVHALVLIPDDFVTFTASELLVPFTGDWKPEAVGLGIVAMYILLTVQLTSLVMGRLPKSLWRAIHLTSYAMFALVTVHAILAGSDSGKPLYVGFSTAMAMLGAAVAGIRLVQGRFVPAAVRARREAARVASGPD